MHKVPAVPIAQVGGEVPVAMLVATAAPRVGVTIVQDVTRQKLPLPLVLPVASAEVTALLVTVCVDPAKCATPAPGDDALTTLAVTIPLSCNVQVVLDTVQSTT